MRDCGVLLVSTRRLRTVFALGSDSGSYSYLRTSSAVRTFSPPCHWLPDRVGTNVVFCFQKCLCSSLLGPTHPLPAPGGPRTCFSTGLAWRLAGQMPLPVVGCECLACLPSVHNWIPSAILFGGKRAEHIYIYIYIYTHIRIYTHIPLNHNVAQGRLSHPACS